MKAGDQAFSFYLTAFNYALPAVIFFPYLRHIHQTVLGW
jgi:hypothetical protein